jgi:hypothetical protein
MAKVLLGYQKWMELRISESLKAYFCATAILPGRLPGTAQLAGVAAHQSVGFVFIRISKAGRIVKKDWIADVLVEAGLLH